ncbi:hypothetical protein JCM8547_003938 [Rhodosporidiobolus lusitaniae]
MRLPTSFVVLTLLSSTLGSAAPTLSASLARRAATAITSTWDLSNLTVAAVRAPPRGWPLPVMNKDWDAADVGYDLNATVDYGVELIAEAAAKGAKVVAFPETWVPGYPKGYDENDWMLKHVDAYIANSLVVGSSQWEQFVAAAATNEVYVGLGYSEREGDHIYMAQALFGPHGEVLIHRHKLRPSGGERDLWSDGTVQQLEVVSTPIGRISMLECWEHFHPAMTFPIQVQTPDLHIGPFPYNPQINDTTAQWWEDVEVNFAATRVFAVNSGAVTLTAGVGGAVIFSGQGAKLAEGEANDSFDETPILYASVNATRFANVTSNANGEQSWDILQQIEAAIPAYIPQVNGTLVPQRNTSIKALEAAAANYSGTHPNATISTSSSIAAANATGTAAIAAVQTGASSLLAAQGFVVIASVALGAAILA